MSSLLVLPAPFTAPSTCAPVGGVTTGWSLFRATGTGFAFQNNGGTNPNVGCGVHPTPGDTILIGDFTADGADGVIAAYPTGAALFRASNSNSAVNPNTGTSGTYGTQLNCTTQIGGITTSTALLAGSFMPHIGQQILQTSSTTLGNMPDGNTWDMWDTSWNTPRNLLTGVDFGLRPIVNSTPVPSIPVHDISVTYQSLADTSPAPSGSVLYTPGHSAAAPVIDVTGPIYVVSQIQRWNGLSNGVNGNSFTTNYDGYKTLQWDRWRRHLIGFVQSSATEVETAVVTMNQRNNVPNQSPFALWNVPTYSITALLGVNRNIRQVAINTYCMSGGQFLSACPSSYPQNSSTVYQRAEQSRETWNWDIDSGNSLTSDIGEAMTYDSYMNVLTYAANSTDGHTLNVTNTYLAADPQHWLLGRLSSRQVTRTSPPVH